MRRVRLMLALLASPALAAGCHFRGDRPTVPQLVRSLAPPVQLEGVVLDHVLVEQPLADPFLNRELWEHVLPVGRPETRALLAENGLRAGIITGTAPQRLQELLESESDTVSPRRLSFQERAETVVPTAIPADPCRYSILTDLAGERRQVELKQARCGICLRPEPAADGGVTIWCEPQVQHGARQVWYRPNEDGTRFIKEEEVPTEKYPLLGFEVTLAPEDYLIIGWPAEDSHTLGAMVFTADANGRSRQRVLVIRARQAKPDPRVDLPPIRDPFERPSVASQAAGGK